jgi:predicted dehydrogenase
MMSLEFGGVQAGDWPVTAQLSLGHYIPNTWPDALGYRRPSSVQIVCENGVAFADLPSTLIWFDQAGQHTESLEQERPVGEQMLTLFHRAVTSLIRRTSDLNDAYRATAIVLAGNRSIAEGRRIELKF